MTPVCGVCENFITKRAEPYSSSKKLLHFVLGFENIARITNAVQVTLWLSVTISVKLTMSRFQFLNLSGVVNCVNIIDISKSLNHSQCLCPCVCLLVGYTMSPNPSDQLLEITHMCLQQLCIALKMKTLKSFTESLTHSVSDKVTYWAVLDSLKSLGMYSIIRKLSGCRTI